MKEYHFGVMLQRRELNLVLRKTGMIVRQVQFGRFFRESTVRISKVLLEIMKGISNIILQVMCLMDGHFNNLTRLEKNFSESSYKARELNLVFKND